MKVKNDFTYEIDEIEIYDILSYISDNEEFNDLLMPYKLRWAKDRLSDFNINVPENTIKKILKELGKEKYEKD